MLSYQNIYALPKAGVPVGDFHRFRRVEREGFNVTDVNDTRFFKLFFYFYNESNPQISGGVDFFNGGSSGLLAPTWLDDAGINSNEYYKYNSAWAYLKNNYEEERAKTLENFIELLSEISSNSPWYFQKVTGVDEALGREKWQIEEERKKISIECLADPVDRRIESLLSMYRSIVWSHQHKCEVLPANLRKFDMGLFVFSGLVEYLNVDRDSHIYNIDGREVMTNITKGQNNWTPMGHVGNPVETLRTDRAAYKYIEFHNCEISMDSIKSGYNELNNADGTEQIFTIDIYFDDCYENEYNPFLMQTFGDFFIWDAWAVAGYKDDGTPLGSIPQKSVNIITGYQPSNGENTSENDNYTQITSNLQNDMNNRLYPVYHENEQESLQTTNVTSISQNNLNIQKGSEEKGGVNKIIEDIKNNTSAQKEKISKNINDLIPGREDIENGIVSRLTRLGNMASSAISGTVNSAVNSAVSAVTGSLGTIYDNAIKGIAGAADAVEGELEKQIKSIQSKITGNIYDTTIKASESVTEAVINPVLGTIKKEGQAVADALDVVHENTKDSTKTLGNMIGENLYGNQIGMNRLNAAKLGNMYHETII